LLDIHAVAEGWEHADEWRRGTRQVNSWSVREVSTGSRLASVIHMPSGMYELCTVTGERSSHPGFSLAMAAARDAFVACSPLN
jgi:hypothetical protein